MLIQDYLNLVIIFFCLLQTSSILDSEHSNLISIFLLFRSVYMVYVTNKRWKTVGKDLKVVAPSGGTCKTNKRTIEKRPKLV